MQSNSSDFTGRATDKEYVPKDDMLDVFKKLKSKRENKVRQRSHSAQCRGGRQSGVHHINSAVGWTSMGGWLVVCLLVVPQHCRGRCFYQFLITVLSLGVLGLRVKKSNLVNGYFWCLHMSGLLECAPQHGRSCHLCEVGFLNHGELGRGKEGKKRWRRGAAAKV